MVLVDTSQLTMASFQAQIILGMVQFLALLHVVSDFLYVWHVQHLCMCSGVGSTVDAGGPVPGADHPGHGANSSFSLMTLLSPDCLVTIWSCMVGKGANVVPPVLDETLSVLVACACNLLRDGITPSWPRLFCQKALRIGVC